MTLEVNIVTLESQSIANILTVDLSMITLLAFFKDFVFKLFRLNYLKHIYF